MAPSPIEIPAPRKAAAFTISAPSIAILSLLNGFIVLLYLYVL
jgi:hypothetical protein